MPDPNDGSPAPATPPPQPPSGWSVQQPPPQPPPPGWGAVPPPPPAASAGPGWAPPPPAPRPGVIPLRPLTVSEVLEGAWGVFRRHWRLLVPLAAGAAAATAAASLPYTLALSRAVQPLLELDPERATRPQAEAAVDQLVGSLGGLAAWVLVSWVVSVAAVVVVLGAVALVTGQAVLGRPAPWATVWPRLRARLGGVLGTGALIAFGWLVAVAVAVGAPTLLFAALGWAGVGLGLVLSAVAVPLIAYLMVRWVVAVPAAALEGASPATALRRSGQLVAGHWWRTCGLLLLLALVHAAVSGVVSTPLSFAAQFESGTPTQPVDPDAFVGIMLVSLLAQAVTTAVVLPFVSAAVAVKYLDLRMRQDGLADQLAAADGDVKS